MKKEVSKQKNNLILILVLAVLFCLLVASVVYMILPEDNGTSDKKHYYVPNYEEDIFQNKAYMSFDRDLLYGALGVEQRFNYEKDYEIADRECKFFLDYFHTVISGNYEKLPEFYVSDYFDEEVKFTMQMIYEPRVSYHSVSTDKIDGKEVTLLNFHVEYRIFKNNETFRPGVPSNTSVPQIYQLLKMDDGNYKIYRILDVKTENDS